MLPWWTPPPQLKAQVVVASTKETLEAKHCAFNMAEINTKRANTKLKAQVVVASVADPQIFMVIVFRVCYFEVTCRRFQFSMVANTIFLS
jgi:hypothetical protein